MSLFTKFGTAAALVVSMHTNAIQANEVKPMAMESLNQYHDVMASKIAPSATYTTAAPAFTA